MKYTFFFIRILLARPLKEREVNTCLDIHLHVSSVYYNIFLLARPLKEQDVNTRLDIHLHVSPVYYNIFLLARPLKGEIEKDLGYVTEQLKTEKDVEIIEYLCGKRNLATDLLSFLDKPLTDKE